MVYIDKGCGVCVDIQGAVCVHRVCICLFNGCLRHYTM